MDQSKKSGLATAGLVLGIIAIVGAWIPFLNIVSIILAVLALIFGGIALAQKKSTGKAIAGLILGVVSIIVAVYMLSAATTAIDEAVNSTGTTSNGSTGQEENGEPAQTIFGVDEAISFDGKTVTVSGVERNWYSGNQYIAPDSGNEYVKVQVEIKNDSNNQISYNVFDWKIKNSDGNIKDVDSTAFMTDGGLNSGELAEGGRVSGFLVFQAPNGDEGLVLQYSPSFWTDRKLEIKL